MIPKKIHYCWFGGNSLPKSAKKCIKSWKKFFPDYEIIQWNEDNYNVNKIQYTKEAYEAKKYAFVSDYARFDILYNEGGIYFDTDVEVIKSFNDILMNGAFMGCEIDGNGTGNTGKEYISVNPGLGIATERGTELFKEIIDFYSEQTFLNADGTLNTETVVTKTTNILKNHGLKDINGIQKVEEITIYPKDYFNPLNNNTGKLDKTENTHSVHWYSMTWLSPFGRLKSKITRPLHRIFGEDVFHKRG
jgi:mannosyltransferase OCH1-like enzyme